MSTSKKTASVAGFAALATAIAAPVIMAFEGKRNTAYLDPVNIPTACYGHTGAGVYKGKYYSDAECKALLDGDIRSHMDGVLRCTPGLAAHPNRLAAATSLTFNIGVAKYCRSSIARRFNAGDWRGACAGFSAWIYAGGRKLNGLVRRRAAERELCERGSV